MTHTDPNPTAKPVGDFPTGTTRYIYIEYFNGGRELYDLRADPFELQNLAGSPGTRPLQRSG